MDALAIYRELGDKKSVGIVQNNIARMEIWMGRPHVALAAAQESLQVFQELGLVGKGQVPALETVVAAFLAKGEPHEALGVVAENLEWYRILGESNAEAALLLASVSAHTAFKDPQSALKAARDARQICKETGDRRHGGKAAFIIAERHLLQQELEDALSSAQEALQCLKELTRATQNRDETAFESIMLKINSIAGVTDTELSDALDPIVRKDAASARFLKAHASRRLGSSKA